jgi:hypothetical protein
MLRQMLRLLREDRTLVTVAALGTLLTVVAAVGIFGGASALLDVVPRHGSTASRPGAFGLVLSLALFFPVVLLATALNVVVVAIAQARLDGRPMSLGDAARFCVRRRRAIVGWTLLDVGIGTTLQRLADRLPLGGAIVAWLAGTAWSLASMFAVPALVVEDVGPIAATRRSAAVFRARWGEGVSATVQTGSLAMAGLLPGVALILVGVVDGFNDPLDVTLVLSGAALTAFGIVLGRTLQELAALAIYRSHVLGVETFGLAAAELDDFVGRGGRFS